MMELTRIGIDGLTMGCKDDDTCDQPVTKGDMEGQYNILFYQGLATFLLLLLSVNYLDMKMK